MTYSCSDFADDVFAELHRVGAITEEEANDADLDDNASLQADYALAGIGRLVAARDANTVLVIVLEEIMRVAPYHIGHLAETALAATANTAGVPSKPKLNEIAQVVVFASGGITQAVAVRDLPDGGVPCIVVDYDDRHDDAGDTSPEDFERKKLGVSREEFDKSASYIL